MLTPCRMQGIFKTSIKRTLQRDRQDHTPGDGGPPHPCGRQAGQCRLAQQPQRTGSRGLTLFARRQREGKGWAGGAPWRLNRHLH